MLIKLICHSMDYTYLVPHQWNDNIPILSVTTSSRNNLVGPLTVSRTSTNDRICSKLRNYSGFSLTRRREWANEIPNVGWICKFPWEDFLSYRYIFLVQCPSIHDVNFNRYWGNIVPITTWLLRCHSNLKGLTLPQQATASEWNKTIGKETSLEANEDCVLWNSVSSKRRRWYQGPITT